LADNLNMNLIGAITIRLYDGSHNLLATKTAKLAHIKELTATQKQFSSAFIVQSGTYPTGGVSSSWEVGAWLPAIDRLSLFYTVDGGNSWERAGFSGSVDRTFSWTVPARFSSRAKVIMYAMDASPLPLSSRRPPLHRLVRWCHWHLPLDDRHDGCRQERHRELRSHLFRPRRGGKPGRRPPLLV